VHKHSQAKAFSIFRSHDLFKPKHASKPANRSASGYQPVDPPRHQERSGTVHEYQDYRRLKTHGFSRNVLFHPRHNHNRVMGVRMVAHG